MSELTTNKADLIEAVKAEIAEITNADAERAVNAVFNKITSSLESDVPVVIVGFGSFKVTDRKAREGRNPRTGEVIHIPASRAVTFKNGKALKEAVNKG